MGPFTIDAFRHTLLGEKIAAARLKDHLETAKKIKGAHQHVGDFKFDADRSEAFRPLVLKEGELALTGSVLYGLEFPLKKQDLTGRELPAKAAGQVYPA